MAKMNIAPQDRPRVKFECLRLLATLQLAPVRMQLISGFIDTYLRLNASETELFRTEINRISPVEQEVVMRIVTSWIEEGLQQGRQEEAVALIMRLLPRRIGTVEPDLQVRIRQLSLIQLENLAEALLDFSQPADLVNWLDSQEVLRVEICIL
jgi:predicted transposase YdaD